MRNMIGFVIAPASLLTVGFLVAHPIYQQTGGRPELAGLFDFEAPHTGDVPQGWGGGPAGTFAVDGQIVHSGRWALRIDRNEKSPGAFSTVTKMLPIDFAGTRLELHGFLRTQDVSDFAGLWMREDGDSGSVAFDNMQRRQLKGTTEWTEYSITLPLDKAAKRLFFGVLASGAGRVWADDLRLLVDGQPIETAPRIELPKTVLDLDHDFDGGSGIALKQLSPIQVANLAMLGKVWGLLKYHHPLIVAGKRHWDYELFRVLPRVLAAADGAAARSVVHQWSSSLGDIPGCTACASLLEANLHLRPPLAWLTDDQLGPELGGWLRQIHVNRPANGRQFYLSLVPGIGNPSFDHELAYANLQIPDVGYQLLALYRLWNIIEYWYPYRDLLENSWDDELMTFIPRVALASTADEYKRELLALMTRINDTHANLWSSLDARPPVGRCSIPATLRFIDNQLVVTGTPDTAPESASALQRGDIVGALDGVSVTELVERWSPFYAASNEPTRLRDIAASMTRGACGAATIGVSRNNAIREVKAERVPESTPGPAPGRTHDRKGETFQRLSPEVAYLKLSTVRMSQTTAYIEAAAGTKGLIIDIRNYPSEFMVFALGSRLVDRPTEFARFTVGDPANPGAFHWTAQPMSISPTAPQYSGKIVILVDESSQSQAEYTTMAFRSAPNAIVVGSTTAGADGNVSPIPLPGGLRSMISGIGVFYPDKKPTQRIGIVADIEVRPTLQGIRSGRDEVLEAALRHILGADVPAAEIQRLAKQ
jgi:C-terminal processing protease CtpA/Prc